MSDRKHSVANLEDLRNIQLRPIRNRVGEQMDLITWHRRVMAGTYNSHDGIPYLATFTEESNISIWSLIEADIRIPSWATHIIWYEK